MSGRQIQINIPIIDSSSKLIITDLQSALGGDGSPTPGDGPTTSERAAN
jgi:hypothetical protein